VTPFERRIYARFPAAQRAVRAGVYWSRELVILGMAKNPRLMRPVERLARAHLARQVGDPDLRKRLRPRYLAGCKRLLLSNDYYPAVASANVDLVTEGIAAVGEHSITTTTGREIPVDTIILGTGFEVTHPPIASRIRGAGGRTLEDAWGERGLQAFRGTTVPGFPNLFFLAGPNTGIGHTSLVVMIEAQIRYVGDAIETMRRRRLGRVEILPGPFSEYNDAVQHRLEKTVWNTGGCASWYLDEHGRNTTLWPDFTYRFVRSTRHFDVASYAIDPVLAPAEAPELISA
jgi:cyclohexanone monooxygenase